MNNETDVVGTKKLEIIDKGKSVIVTGPMSSPSSFDPYQHNWQPVGKDGKAKVTTTMTRYENSVLGLGKALQHVTDTFGYGKQCSGEQQGETSSRNSQSSKQSKMSEDDDANTNKNDDDSNDDDQQMGKGDDDGNGSEDEESQSPPAIVRTTNYKRYKWIIKGRPELFSNRFNLYHFFMMIEQSSPNTIWYPTNEVTFPPMSPFNDVQSGFPAHADVQKFFNIGVKNKKTQYIEIEAEMRYSPLEVKNRFNRYMRNTNVIMENKEIREKTWDIVGFIWGFQDGIQWRPTYEQQLNQEITIVLSEYTPPYLTDEIESLSDEAKNIKIDLKPGSFSGNSAKIEGVLIKTKSCN